MQFSSVTPIFFIFVLLFPMYIFETLHVIVVEHVIMVA